MMDSLHAFIWWGVFVLGSTLLMYASVLIWLAPTVALKAAGRNLASHFRLREE